MIYSTSRIKQTVNMVNLAERYGVKIKHGMCCCPFHGEKHPSMKIYKDGYRCFACGEYGDVISWVQKFDGVGFQDACKRLSELYGIDCKATAEIPAERRKAELMNAYSKAKQRVKQLEPKDREEPPTQEFWQAIEKRNRLEELVKNVCIVK